ncbi:hypothetical protein [Dysgonomonas gadei]|uniref:hypothetical protein n=1 Tax=Dysgonomonas gadei TaxID=156974 RepID=UPI003AEF729E
MKKKIVIFMIYIIACANVFSQNSQNISGEYKFSQVVITAKDFRSKAPVFTKVFTDSLQVITQNWDFPPQPVFSKATIANGQIVEFTLLNNGYTYMITGENTLEKRDAENEVPDKKDQFSDNYFFPKYTILEQGNSITIVFNKTIYGTSNYPNQTLEGVYEMILIKQ